MNKLKLLVFLLWSSLAFASTIHVVITNGDTGQPATNPRISAVLVGCAAPYSPISTVTNLPTDRIVVFSENGITDGTVTGTLLDNSLITCNGVANTTLWQLTAYWDVGKVAWTHEYLISGADWYQNIATPLDGGIPEPITMILNPIGNQVVVAPGGYRLELDGYVVIPNLSVTNCAGCTDLSGLAQVATSGSYNDLINKPFIPAAQVNSDWNAGSGLPQILNKPSLAAVATSGSYVDLGSKPTIPSPSSTVPLMDGTGAIGTSPTYALADHTHPSDTAKASLAVANTWPQTQTMPVLDQGGAVFNALAYSTLQATVTAAGTTGTVLIPPSYAGTDSFTNPNNVRVFDMRRHYSIDSGIYRDVREWGAKLDAIGLIGGGSNSCTVSSGLATITCPNASFTAADNGKVLVCYGCGAASGGSGLVTPPTVASGGTGCTNGTHGVTFTNGFTTGTQFAPPQASVLVSGGVPTGVLSISNPGWGLSSVPTTGTVGTCTGTVTFTGGSLGGQSNLETTLTYVSPTQVTMAATAGVTGNVNVVYGTDDTAAYQAMFNAFKGNNSSGELGYGKLSFCGLSIISSTVVATSFGGEFTGCGWGSWNGEMGSKLIWAGAADSPMLTFSAGEGATIHDFELYGNASFAPIGVQMLRNGGAYINSYNRLDHVWIGPMYDGPPDTMTGLPYTMSTGIFANGPSGNDDFERLTNMFINQAKYGFDSNSVQATYWDWQTLLLLNADLGFACVAQSTGRNWFFGNNLVDIVFGSPSTASMTGTCIIDQFGSEASTQLLTNTNGGAGQLEIKAGKFQQFNNWVVSSGKVIDLSDLTNGYRSVQLENFIFSQQLPYAGPSLHLVFGYSGVTSVAQYARLFNVSNINASNITLNQGYSVFPGIVTSNVILDWCTPPGNGNAGSCIRYGTTAGDFGTTTYRSDVQGALNVIGGPAHIKKAYLPQDTNVLPQGTTGSTVYKYKVSCVAGGHESLPSASFQTSLGSTTLSSTNFNVVAWWPMQGCDSYNVYGDGGLGGVFGLYSNVIQQVAPDAYAAYVHADLLDQGQYTLGAAPPTSDGTGGMTVDGTLNVVGAYQLNGAAVGSYVTPTVTIPTNDLVCALGGDTINGVACANTLGNDCTATTCYFTTTVPIPATYFSAGGAGKRIELSGDYSVWANNSAAMNFKLKANSAVVYTTVGAFTPPALTHVIFGNNFDLTATDSTGNIWVSPIGTVIPSATASDQAGSVAQPNNPGVGAYNISLGFSWAATGLASGTYTSGGSITGTVGQTCNLATFTPGCGNSAATVTLTGTNTIAGGTALVVTTRGGNCTSAPTAASLSSGTATCSGTAVVSTTLGTPSGDGVFLGPVTVKKVN